MEAFDGGGSFGRVELGARVGAGAALLAEVSESPAADLERGTAIFRLSIALFLPGNSSSSLFRFLPTRQWNSPSNLGFFLAPSPSSLPFLALFPSTCDSATLGNTLC